MSENRITELQILQENLCDLRKIAGWTAEILAGKMGVTKQTVSNLETQKVKISRVQYIAIRAILECEMAARPENTTLRRVMDILFAAGSGVYVSQREQIRTAMTAIASIATAGIGNLQLYSSAVALLASLGRAAAFPERSRGASLKWLMKLLEISNNEEIFMEENKNEDN